ncbi:hypothetical protein VD0002_g254 [Verticillium dahliae]|uniref:Protease synthase and sporulation negative regulatory protein PAI 1 n=2 Tax=Verticillium dahliae TaxID=27337 RepID=G2WY48_VERDV|nr:protease synthase and sporulation negative regulatory protein PAI 1 [Verticillium dahliae VdLs.17]KAF3351010.1 hypothetical protein VdG2_00517 [Verticillium dahliae VDG2]KAG7106186.1 hypothetical protein HYQ44_014482 [Verticillium longisporum]KAH6705526.1 protease synthase and sporulation negative regulatory protein PAI 1 [Verticillium dahliae]EGY21006.1 protease synthase and sporulation negative regulatory protein PAI 1 [Verticillium dahliae VdLs.17]PNH27900.1 hypothetical protein BJF96_g8
MSSATTTPAPALRRATLQDAEAVSALGSSVFSATFGHSVTPQQLQAYLDESYSVAATARDIEDTQKDMTVAVAADGDGTTIIGFVLLTRGGSEPCVDDVASKIELQRIYVSAAHHGQGVGKLLIHEAQRQAREQGFEHMWLGVWEENHKAAQMYAKLGFSVVGEHEFDVGGDIQTDRIMLKKL